MNAEQNYDLIIAGAGMVGATLANALADRGLRIAIIEKHPPRTSWDQDSVDLRVSAITLASQQIFTHLDAWQRMEAMRVSPFYAMTVWDAGGNGSIHFDSADVGARQLGHIIENRVIQAALLERLQEFTDIELHCPTQIKRLQQQQDCIRVQLDNGSELTTRLLVGADGGRSSIRHMVGIETSGWSYRQQALVTVVETEQHHQHTAWQRFLPNGPLAFLPLADGRSSIVWSTTPEQAQALLDCEEETFCQQLGSAFAHRLGAITTTLERASFPLQRQHAKQYIHQRIALIGDAAHTIHPLAGQGVNLGLLDAAALAEIIIDCHQRNLDYGSQRMLRRYERWRKGDNLLTMSLMDGFKHLFGSSSEPVRWLRNNGLNLTDSLTPIKHELVYQAMGRKRDLPRMARPVL